MIKAIRNKKDSVKKGYHLLILLGFYLTIIPLIDLKIIGLLIILSNVLLIKKFSDNFIVLTIFLFVLWSNYSILFVNVFFPKDSYATMYSKGPLFEQSIYILFLFNFALYLLLKDISVPLKQIDFFKTPKKPSNIIIVYILLFALSIFYIVGFNRPVIEGERADGSALYEYSFVLFILAYFYSKRSLERILITILLFAYVLQSVTFGSRASAIPLLIVLFLVKVKANTSLLKLLPWGILFLIFFTAVGNFRTTLFHSGTNDIFMSTIESMLESGFTFDTSYYAYLCSLTFVKFKDTISFADQLYYLFQYIQAIFIGGGVRGANLARVTQKFYEHQNGGVLPYFAYFYLGSLGVLLLATYLKILIKGAVCGLTGFGRCFGIYIVSSVPRWYLYSPTPLFRGILIFVLCYLLCYIFNNLTKSKVR